MVTRMGSCWPHDCLCYSLRLCGGPKGALRMEIDRVHLHRCGEMGWLGKWQAYRLLRRVCPMHALWLCEGLTRYDLINLVRRKIPPSELCKGKLEEELVVRTDDNKN